MLGGGRHEGDARDLTSGELRETSRERNKLIKQYLTWGEGGNAVCKEPQGCGSGAYVGERRQWSLPLDG